MEDLVYGPASCLPTDSSLLVTEGSHGCGHHTLYIQALSIPPQAAPPGISLVIHYQKVTSREQACPRLSGQEIPAS